MAKQKRKLTAAERRAKRERNLKYEFMFINGKRVRVRCEPMIEGMPVDEFIARNANAIWSHENESWESIPLDVVCSARPDLAEKCDALTEELRNLLDPQAVTVEEDDVPF